MERKFDLNIEKVLENWDISDGIREVIANALDEQALTQTKDIQIFKDRNGWHVRDFGRGIEHKHLTQKENNEKLSKPEIIIGKFGVGLKDALATFDRNKINVRVESKHGVITIEKSEKHGFKDVITLHAIIDEPLDKNFVGTDVVLNGCKDNDIEKAKLNFLKFSDEKLLEKTPFGEIYLREKDASKIYITGLKVAEEENFLLSYNITSMTKTLRRSLNRERSNVGRAAYTERVKAILLSCKSKEVAEKLVQDIQRFQTGKMHDELGWIDVSTHACKLLNSLEKVIFVTPTQLIQQKEVVDKAIMDGHKIITISDEVRFKISGQKDLAGKKMNDIDQYLVDYNDSFEFNFIKPNQLTAQEREIYEKKDVILNLMGGKPRNVKEIRISETMRMQSNGFQAAGLWSDPEIIIKRDQLSKMELFCGTLIHEAIHAKSGYGDVSREFESALTGAIGKICTEIIKKK